MKTKTLTSYLKLLACEGIGVLNARKLLEQFKKASDIFDEDVFERTIENQTTKIRLRNLFRSIDLNLIESEIEFIHKNNIKWVGILDKNYPKLLKECADAPIVLFYKGDLNLLNHHSISIVGTRKMSVYGKEMIEKLIAELKIFNPTIVSGMAYGVDVYTYKETRKSKLGAVAVMGTSFAKYYPKVHSKYYQDLEEYGLILTEYTAFNKLAPELFLRRNRIIAGLSRATVVIESAETGGSLSTAIFASEYGREVYALPGKITDEFSKGCLKLIQQNKAQLLYDFSQIADDLSWNRIENTSQKVSEPILDLKSFSETEQKIVKCLQNKTLHIDEIAIESDLDMSILNANLMMLELNGVIVSLQGKMFKLK